MCGRYASSRKPEDLVEEFRVTRADVDKALQPDYNVAPTKEVYAVLDRAPRRRESSPPPDDATATHETASDKTAETQPDAPTEPESAERRLTTVTWGLVPSWAKDRSIGNRMINARVETLAEKPAFRRAFRYRRCLLPADGYYEWYPTSEKTRSGKPRKQPFFIHRRDGGVLGMAGLYEIWRDPEVEDPSADEAWLWTATVITTSAEDELGRIHDRMPMLVEPERYDEWLSVDTTDPEALRNLLVPARPGLLEAYPVSTEVNNVGNNGPELVEPLPLEDTVDPADTLFAS